MIGWRRNPVAMPSIKSEMGGRSLRPSDDPYAPAYWRVDFIPRYGWRAAGRGRDGQAPRSWGMRPH